MHSSHTLPTHVNKVGGGGGREGGLLTQRRYEVTIREIRSLETFWKSVLDLIFQRALKSEVSSLWSKERRSSLEQVCTVGVPVPRTVGPHLLKRDIRRCRSLSREEVQGEENGWAGLGWAGLGWAGLVVSTELLLAPTLL